MKKVNEKEIEDKRNEEKNTKAAEKEEVTLWSSMLISCRRNSMS